MSLTGELMTLPLPSHGQKYTTLCQVFSPSISKVLQLLESYSLLEGLGM